METHRALRKIKDRKEKEQFHPSEDIKEQVEEDLQDAKYYAGERERKKNVTTLCLRRHINSSKLARKRTISSSSAADSPSNSKMSYLRYKMRR
jgi:hypothetical protein